MKQAQATERQPMPHALTLHDRRRLTVSGVTDVNNFDDVTVVVDTELGALTVKGHGLHIQQLNIECGDLAIEGEIDSLVYSQLPTHSGGFFGRLFR